MKTQDPREQLSGLQEEQLFALARNEAAQWLYRKAAAGLLKESGHLKASHPEIAHVLGAFLADVTVVSHESEVAPVVEKPVSESKTAPITPVLPVREANVGPFAASVTTATLSADPIVENGQK